MKLHSDKEILKAAKGLSDMVLNLEKQCDRSKLDKIELELLQEAAAQARLVVGELYDPEQEDPSFK